MGPCLGRIPRPHVVVDDLEGGAEQDEMQENS